MLKIEHIGIAVKNIEEANTLFTVLLGEKNYKTEIVVSEKVNTSFFKIGESKIELLQATDSESPIAKFLEKRGEGVHHIAFAVRNIDAKIKQLQEQGFQFIADIPKKGADNKLICFLHPKSTKGILIELCQE